MNAIEILPFILFLVVIVTAIAERISIPYPLLLVVAGLFVGFMPGFPTWHPPSNIILALFLPPILFAAARTISWQDIRTHLDTIGSLSIVLVFITTIIIAIVIDLFVPRVSFSSALVLGAIISPTDTVAAVAILSKMNVRQHIIRTIEIESLFNDATGIVLYNAAILFVALGNIDLLDITWRTVLIGAGGIGVGLILAYCTGLIIQHYLTQSENELPIIMSLILAYVAYLLANRLGFSGVLAVVAAGLYHKRTENAVEARTRLSEKSVWDSLIFFLNGIIFITIGAEFPSFLNKVNYISMFDLILFSIITIVTLLILRLIWVTITYSATRFFHRSKKSDEFENGFPYKKIIIISWAGMRGLVPLALALAIPTMIANNQPFPNRDIIIFLTIVTILFTLLAQGLTLPSLIKKLKAGKDDKKELQTTTEIYQRMTKKAIENMNRLIGKDKKYSDAAKKLVENYYANRLLRFNLSYETQAESHEIGKEAEDLLAKILYYERRLLIKLRNRGEISEEVFIRIAHKLDRDEVGFASYR